LVATASLLIVLPVLKKYNDSGEEGQGQLVDTPTYNQFTILDGILPYLELKKSIIGRDSSIAILSYVQKTLIFNGKVL